MVDYLIPADGFFICSPKILIRHDPAVEDTVREAEMWIEQQDKKIGRMNCQLHPDSDEERDGHLARLIGVKKMHDMLLELNDKTEYLLIYHEKEKPWCVSNDEHPCGMLAYNDKWWMTFSDDCNLSRYGQRGREEKSCVPVQMRGERWYKFSVKGCKYCNGDYDKTIQLALD